NMGSVTAKIIGIETVGLDTTDIKVTYSGIGQDERMAPNEERNMKIKVTWDSASTTIVDSLTFSISINYEQLSGSDVTVPPAEEMTKDMFTWDSDTIVSGLSDKGIDYLKSNGGHLVIPEGVTEIASVSYDFINDTGGLFDKGFSPVKIGNIDNVTFEQLTQHSIISSVSFPSSLTKIGAGAFAYNFNLTGELSLPTGLNEIGDGAFFSSSISGNLIMPNSVVGIGHRAFERTNITGVTFGSTLEGIGQSAFAYCNNLAGELYIPDGVKNIGRLAFYFDGLDSKITSVSIPSTVSYVSSGVYATFYGRVSPTVRN
ncbi:MAG: leucine-rich repeat domain-containing protein, partial [Bacilli bacterium]|nr:leucine-rich repeat domain-containing protein [Bacilli bacterium]